jgi:hypothetical protein
MRKILLTFILFTFLTGCSGVQTTLEDTYDLLDSSTGFVYFAALVEVNSNFSSLLYDKTKADYKNYTAKYYEKLPIGKKYFVMTAKIIGIDKTVYTNEYTEAMKNFIRLNKLGTITDSPEKADIIVVTNIENSFNRNYGENFSKVSITFFKPDNTIVFYTKVKSVSRSDRNFFYHPTKKARPVEYLAVKGFERLINKSFEKLYYREDTQEDT